MGDYGIGVPGARIDAVAEVTPPRGHKAHPRRARRLHVAQIVADVDAVPRWKREEHCGLEQRGRVRLDVRGRVAAHDAGGAMADGERAQQRLGETLCLVGDDTPTQVARLDL